MPGCGWRWFKAEGLNVDPQRFRSAAAMIPVLGTGQLDAGGGSSSAAFSMPSRPACPSSSWPTRAPLPVGIGTYVGTMVRKNLIDSGRVKDFKDLKGLTIS